VATIEKSGSHLLGLLDEILDLSKIESGRMELYTVDFHLNELITDLDAMFAVRCGQKQVRWIIESTPTPLPSVHGDRKKLAQVLLNLLGNAVKFTERGEVRLRVQPAPEGEHWYQFEVMDTGNGIAPEMRERIFEPFTQGNEGLRKGGTGLGLAIANRQVQLLGGKLGLESEVSRGSRFYFSVPLPPAKADLPPTKSPAPLQVRRLKAGIHLRALVVDDIAENRQVLASLLSAVGVESALAGNGREALEQLRRQPFDIVFMDIQMPEMGGLEAAQQIIKEMGASRPKLVAISSSVLMHEQSVYFEAGFDDFIPKPFQWERVCDSIEKALGVLLEAADLPAIPPAPLSSETLSAVNVPGELLMRLQRAAEVCAITEIEEPLSELAALGPAARSMAENLRQLSQNLEFDKILQLLAQAPRPPAEVDKA
jgi:CheY-like chemotaxis protein